MEGLCDHLARFRDSFLSSDHSHMPVNDGYVRGSPPGGGVLSFFVDT